MNDEIKAEWLRRLRSGEIPQVTGMLGRDDGSRCCLGVLQDLAVEAGVITRRLDSEQLCQVYEADDYTEQSMLLPATVSWADITSDDDGDIELRPGTRQLDEDGDPVRVTLSGLNDEGFSFSQIADLIERYL